MVDVLSNIHFQQHFDDEKGFDCRIFTKAVFLRSYERSLRPSTVLIKISQTERCDVVVRKNQRIFSFVFPCII